MYKFKIKNLKKRFIMRKSKKISYIGKYVECLRRNNIKFTKERYEEAKKL